jgi:hypothetical protein
LNTFPAIDFRIMYLLWKVFIYGLVQMSQQMEVVKIGGYFVNFIREKIGEK